MVEAGFLMYKLVRAARQYAWAKDVHTIATTFGNSVKLLKPA